MAYSHRVDSVYCHVTDRQQWEEEEELEEEDMCREWDSSCESEKDEMQSNQEEDEKSIQEEDGDSIQEDDNQVEPQNGMTPGADREQSAESEDENCGK